MRHSKGRTTYSELYNMDVRFFHVLYSDLRKMLSTEEGRENVAADEIEEQVEEEVGIDG